MAFRAWNSSLKRSGPIGYVRRANSRAEEGFYPTWEDLLRLHRLDFWHCRVTQQSQPGWPDYAVFGDGWLGFVELKARSPLTKRMGRVSTEQERYKASIEAAGGEYKVFKLPDDWHDVDVWLNGHTGREIWGWAASQKASAGLVTSGNLEEEGESGLFPRHQ